MRALIETDIDTFPVPSYVTVMNESGVTRPSTEKIGGSTILLKNLSVDTLLVLCEIFKHEVFAQAGKEVPTTNGLINSTGITKI